MLDALGRGRGLARRYLAIEGHRALAVNELALPPDVARLIEHGREEALLYPTIRLRAGREQRSIKPDWILGDIHPRQVRSDETEPVAAAVVDNDGTQASQPKPVDAADLDTLDDDEGFDVGNLMTSPVGGGGPLGSCWPSCSLIAPRQAAGGLPGADAPTHYGVPVQARGPCSSRPRRSPRLQQRPLCADIVHLPGVGRTGERLSAQLVFCPRTRCRRGFLDHGDHARHARAMRRVLAPLGLGLAPSRRQKQGEDIDIDAVVRSTGRSRRRFSARG